MKKRMIFGVAMAALLVCSTAFAQCNSSDAKSATAQIITQGGTLCGIMVTTDGTNAQTFNIYDTDTGTTSGSTKLIPAWVVTTSGTDRAQTLPLDVKFSKGLYITVSGSGTVGYVAYIK